MIIPAFNEYGELPEGIYECTIDEFEKFFSTNIIRRNLFKGLVNLINDIKRLTNCHTIFIDGSYVTNKFGPGDIDILWESYDEPDYDLIEKQMPVLLSFDELYQKGKYECHIFPAKCKEDDSGLFFVDFFQKVKFETRKKGIIKIKL